MRFSFTKMHGIGNDYVYVNGFEETIDDPSEAASPDTHSLSEDEERDAVFEMLQLRQNLMTEYKARGESFPYLNE